MSWLILLLLLVIPGVRKLISGIVGSILHFVFVLIIWNIILWLGSRPIWFWVAVLFMGSAISYWIKVAKWPSEHETWPTQLHRTVERELDSIYLEVDAYGGYKLGYREDDPTSMVRIQFPGKVSSWGNPEIAVKIDTGWIYLPDSPDYEVLSFAESPGGEVKVPLPKGCTAIRFFFSQYPDGVHYVAQPYYHQLVTLEVGVRDGQFTGQAIHHPYQDGDCPVHPVEQFLKEQNK